MFALINIYIAKGENSFLPEVVYKKGFNTILEAENEMNKQVDDILVNHYCRYYEDENGEQNFSVLRLKGDIRIDACDVYDWWKIVEI
jgi:hypothetical protein|uniref:Uncharacterized protein n=1 Tax=Siphoviridae sp. ctGa111 TaxID=2825413 RepID=A0A8S5VDP7_9CAUD|nr:MAG TPA: hypothetical protein [Siphoviridae sp. ctGa111]